MLRNKYAQRRAHIFCCGALEPYIVRLSLSLIRCAARPPKTLSRQVYHFEIDPPLSSLLRSVSSLQPKCGNGRLGPRGGGPSYRNSQTPSPPHPSSHFYILFCISVTIQSCLLAFVTGVLIAVFGGYHLELPLKTGCFLLKTFCVCPRLCAFSLLHPDSNQTLLWCRCAVRMLCDEPRRVQFQTDSLGGLHWHTLAEHIDVLHQTTFLWARRTIPKIREVYQISADVRRVDVSWSNFQPRSTSPRALRCHFFEQKPTFFHEFWMEASFFS